jgi:hypothetical protein
MRIAGWSRKLSLLVGGLMAFAVPIALVDALIGSGHANWANPWGGDVGVTALGAAWRGAVLLIGAYLVLYLALPAVLMRIAFGVFPPEYIDAALDAHFSGDEPKMTYNRDELMDVAIGREAR